MTVSLKTLAASILPSLVSLSLVSLSLVTGVFVSLSAHAQKAGQKVSATALEAAFNATEDTVTVTYSFTNSTSRPMYLTDDGTPQVKAVHFEPTETCILLSKLQKPAPGQLDIPVKARRVNPGKKFSSTMSWKIPLRHDGEIPKGWSKDDKPTCKNLRFEIAAIPGYDDLKPAQSPENGKDYYLLSKEARRHQETQTAEAEGFEIPYFAAVKVARQVQAWYHNDTIRPKRAQLGLSLRG